MTKTKILIVFALTAALIAGCSPGRTAPPVSPSAETGVTVGKAAPRFTLNDLNGTAVGSPEQGRITVINFWATWCPPCRQEMPELQKFQAANGDMVAFHSVNIQESAAQVQAYFGQYGFSMPVLLDPGDAARVYRVSAIPTTVVVDRQGIIKYRKTGPVTAAELEGVIRGL